MTSASLSTGAAGGNTVAVGGAADACAGWGAAGTSAGAVTDDTTGAEGATGPGCAGAGTVTRTIIGFTIVRSTVRSTIVGAKGASGVDTILSI